MQVYALMAQKDYEGLYIYGVYGSIQDAQLALHKLILSDDDDGYYDNFYAVRMQLGEDASSISFDNSRFTKLEV